jgi:uncharacterized membrane protein YdbT with pleckstrin-like domain
MGRYIDEILQPDEKVLFSTKVHWIVYWPAILAWIVALTFFMLQRGATTDWANILWLSLFALFGLTATYWSFKAWFRRWTTETTITNHRVVHKEGFIQRRTFEMNLDKVESVDVNQSIPGRMFGYGDVTIRGVGEGAEPIRTIAAPLQFRNYITAR